MPGVCGRSKRVLMAAGALAFAGELEAQSRGILRVEVQVVDLEASASALETARAAMHPEPTRPAPALPRGDHGPVIQVVAPTGERRASVVEILYLH